LKLYLTDFLNRVFSGEIAMNRDFSGGKKMDAAAVYHALINQGPGPQKSRPCLRGRYLLPGRIVATLAHR
jgi:hypothetical protein